MAESLSRIANVHTVKIPEALVFHPKNGLFFEDKLFDTDEFSVTLRPGMLLIFRRMPSTPECFEVKEVRAANSQDPHLPILGLGVLWSRRAAIEAEKSICAYREAISHYG